MSKFGTEINTDIRCPNCKSYEHSTEYIRHWEGHLIPIHYICSYCHNFYLESESLTTVLVKELFYKLTRLNHGQIIQS